MEYSCDFVEIDHFYINAILRGVQNVIRVTIGLVEFGRFQHIQVGIIAAVQQQLVLIRQVGEELVFGISADVIQVHVGTEFDGVTQQFIEDARFVGVGAHCRCLDKDAFEYPRLNPRDDFAHPPHHGDVVQVDGDGLFHRL